MSRARRSAGFTLMEMLVTLVLFGVLSTLIWQALGTLARVETRLADSRLFVAQEALYAQWARQALVGLMSGSLGDPLRFNGDARSLRGYTTMPPWPGSAGPASFELTLREDPAGATALVARSLAAGSEWPLWAWQGAAAFAYLDDTGAWQPRWPPPLGKHPSLPRAVRLTVPDGRAVLIAVQAGDNPMIRRREVEAQ